MFCGKCGTQIEDGAVSCPNCGVAVTPAPTPSDIIAPKGKRTINFKDPKTLGIIAGAVAVVLLVFLLFGGQSYKSAVNNFMEGVFEADGNQILKSIPDELIDQAMEESGMSRKEMASYLGDELGSMFEELDYYLDDWSVSHKITGTDKYDSDELAELKEDYKDYYDIKIKDALIVEVEMTVKAAGMEESTEIEIGVIKIGSSWYVDMDNVDDLF